MSKDCFYAGLQAEHRPMVVHLKNRSNYSSRLTGSIDGEWTEWYIGQCSLPTSHLIEDNCRSMPYRPPQSPMPYGQAGPVCWPENGSICSTSDEVGMRWTCKRSWWCWQRRVRHPPSTTGCGTCRWPVQHRESHVRPKHECMDGSGIPLWHGSSRGQSGHPIWTLF